MDIWGRLFKKRRELEASVNRAIGAAEERARNPKGPLRSADWGASLRHKLIDTVESVEANTGSVAYALVGEEQELMISPALTAALEAHELRALLQPAFPLLFTTPASKKDVVTNWPTTVGLFAGRRNIAETLQEKASAIAYYILNQYDIPLHVLSFEGTTFPDPDEQIEVELKLEAAGSWCRIIDELASRFIPDKQKQFADYLQDSLAEFLALQGATPSVIVNRMVERSTEYAELHEWLDSDGSQPNTLFWHIGKHALSPLGAEKNFLRIHSHTTLMLAALKQAEIYEILTGLPRPEQPSASPPV